MTTCSSRTAATSVVLILLSNSPLGWQPYGTLWHPIRILPSAISKKFYTCFHHDNVRCHSAAFTPVLRVVAHEQRIRKRGGDVEQTNEAVYDGLARALAEAIRRFYADPANEAEFQEWLKQKKEPSASLAATESSR